MRWSRVARMIAPTVLAVAPIAAVGASATSAGAVDPTRIVLTVTADDAGYAMQAHRYFVKYEYGCYIGNDPIKNATPGFWCLQGSVTSVTLDADPDTATPNSATITLPNEARRYVIYTNDERFMTVTPTCSSNSEGEAYWPTSPPVRYRAWTIAPLSTLSCTMLQASEEYPFTIRQVANNTAGRVPITWVAKVGTTEVARATLDANPATPNPSRFTFRIPIGATDVVVTPLQMATYTALIAQGSRSCTGSPRWNYGGYSGFSVIKPPVGRSASCTLNLGAAPSS